MPKNTETLQPDLLKDCTSQREVFFQQTNEEVWKVLDENSLDFIIKKIKELNPNVEIKTCFDKNIIFSSVRVEDLKLPEWFYYSEKNWITNKYNTQSDVYCCIRVFPIGYYPDSL